MQILHETDPSSVYTARVQSGLYDSVVDQILALPQGTALAMSTYEEDFRRVTNNWSGNFSYQSANTTVEHESILVGQLCHSSMGTKFNARGNHYAGTGFNPIFIEDKSRVKFVFTLSVPTNATHRMQTLWDNQVATLNEVIDADREELKRRSKNLPFKEWTDHSTSDKNLPPDLINVLSGQIYVVRDADPTAKRTKITKKSIAKSSETKESIASRPSKTEELDFDSNMQDDDGNMAESSPHIPEVPANVPTASTNDLYNPSILPDYGGELFRHEKAMLRQLDMRDTDNNLVPPKDWYNTFTPGCLIMARVTLHAFSWESRRVYQLNAHSIRLLDKSIEPVEERLGGVVPNTSDATSSSNTAASAAMSAFSLGKRAHD
ncbi:hypothetical protein BV22DRAFT_1053387 [Leucogyrophana mollusca]|uniref:Uncharacterized protein n=1 Tax=Leucogyrophana mollusca TaxID=85980 RepID=A0ACB8C028_9AGAM|nr:hypothetical protein BV22DRAFT_1053387 [Leucogyrophana mollusca]